MEIPSPLRIELRRTNGGQVAQMVQLGEQVELFLHVFPDFRMTFSAFPL